MIADCQLPIGWFRKIEYLSFLNRKLAIGNDAIGNDVIGNDAIGNDLAYECFDYKHSTTV